MFQRDARLWLVLAAALVAACGPEPNRPPGIAGFEGPERVSAGDSAVYRVWAWDPESRPLAYSWTVTRGMLLADTGYEVLWYSPDSSDTAWLMATVADDSGAVKIESTRVIVMPDTTMFVWWWDGAVKAGDYVSWADTARAGATLAGSATTRADTLDTAYLTIMDEENFQRWVRHEPAQVLLRRVAHEADTFSVRMPATSRYRVVIDNTESALDYNYWIYVLRISP